MTKIPTPEQHVYLRAIERKAKDLHLLDIRLGEARQEIHRMIKQARKMGISTSAIARYAQLSQGRVSKIGTHDE